MVFVKHWYGGDSGQPIDSTTTLNNDGYTEVSTVIPAGGTLLRTLINPIFFTRTTTVAPSDPPWDPSWYAFDLQFNIAITATDGFDGVTIPPLLPQPTQDGEALFIWTAALRPQLDQYIVNDNGITQVVRWVVDTGIRLESFARRGPFTGDAAAMWLAWSVQDVGGYFNNDGAEIQSFTGGRVQTWHLWQQPDE